MKRLKNKELDLIAEWIELAERTYGRADTSDPKRRAIAQAALAKVRAEQNVRLARAIKRRREQKP